MRLMVGFFLLGAALAQAPSAATFEAKLRDYWKAQAMAQGARAEFLASLTLHQRQMQEQVDAQSTIAATAKQSLTKDCEAQGKILSGLDQPPFDGVCADKPKP
jgi:hypothetical protein